MEVAALYILYKIVPTSFVAICVEGCWWFRLQLSTCNNEIHLETECSGAMTLGVVCDLTARFSYGNLEPFAVLLLVSVWG